MAEYFHDRWWDVNKPYSGIESGSLRYVMSQPLYWYSSVDHTEPKLAGQQSTARPLLIQPAKSNGTAEEKVYILIFYSECVGKNCCVAVNMLCDCVFGVYWWCIKSE